MSASIPYKLKNSIQGALAGCGSGLSEEELGSWAVKTNAAITEIEYTLTLPGQHSGAFDLIAMVSHGRGGVKRQDFVKPGSAAGPYLPKAASPSLLFPRAGP